MGVEFLIRHAGEGDAPHLRQIHDTCFKRGWSEDEFLRFLGWPQAYTILVCEVKTNESSFVAGFILFSHLEDEAEILTICVHPDKRSCGLGRGLLREACKYLQVKKTANLFLEVSQKNESAIAFYKSFGFTISGIRQKYSQENDGSYSDAYMMKYSFW